MDARSHPSWNELPPETRQELDREFLRDLALWEERGLSESAVQAYLDYRHQRPAHGITTYEEGRIRALLREQGVGETVRPDPVEQEEHVDPVERFGARRLHLTNDWTYLAIMVALTFVFVTALLALTLAL